MQGDNTILGSAFMLERTRKHDLEGKEQVNYTNHV